MTVNEAGQMIFFPSAESQFISPIEHAPGPRGSPQDPHPCTDWDAAEAPDLAGVANTDNFGVSFLLRHFGHAALSRPNTSASNS